MDATERIKSLLEQRGWTAYRLSKSCGLSENTIATILKRNSLPSVGTLEAICKGFGITLSIGAVFPLNKRNQYLI